MAAVSRKNPYAPSKAAILSYLEKKKKEEEAAKEKRFTEMLNPYKKFGKKTEPDEEFLKAQRKKERLMKKKEEADRKLRDKMDKERLRKQNEELARLTKEQEEHLALEEKKRQQEKTRKQAIFGKPVDKKMQEYLERIKAAREADKFKLSGPEARRAEARKREEEKLQTSAKASKPISDRDIEREREKRILENMRRQQNKSINNGVQKDAKSSNLPSSKVPNGDHVASKRSSVTSKQPPISKSSSSSVTSTTASKVSLPPPPPSSSMSSSNNRIPKVPKSRVSEYSPTRPSIIEKPHENYKSKSSKIEYSPTKVTKTKEGSKSDVHRSLSSSSSQQYLPTPKSAPKSGHSTLKENGHQVKSRSEQPVRRDRGGGDQIARNSTSFESALNPPSKKLAKLSDNAKQSRGGAIVKNGKDSSSERERLLRERELEAERELERQRARNKELEEQLAKLRQEREKEQERKLVAVKPKPALPPMPKRKPIASNKILPPIGLTYRRGMNYQPTYDDDDEEEEDEEMRDFIDDGDDLEAHKNDVSQYIREIFGYDKRKYAMIDEDDIEEATFAQQMKEEMESAKAGLLEDLEDIRKEEEEKRRKAKLKKRRQFIDDSDED